MKTLGLIGGVSWVSTADYYRLINQGINDKLGGLEFSRCIIWSLNYGDLKRNNDNGNPEASYALVSEAAQQLERAGAKALVLCANTMHMFAERLEREINIPIIHIAEATAIAIEKAGLKKVGLLGTKFTMEMDFFKEHLTRRGIETMIPDGDDRSFIHQTIFEELSKGIVTTETKKRYLEIAVKLISEGAQGIILGCTEIPLVILPGELDVPMFDTTMIHSEAAVAFSLAE